MSSRPYYQRIIPHYGGIFLVLMVGVLLVVGCRLTKDRQSSDTTSFSPIVPEQVRGSTPPESVTAYRPPMISNVPDKQEPVITKKVSPAVSTSKEALDNVSPQTIKSDPVVEKLQQRVVELEKILAARSMPLTEPLSVSNKVLPVLNVPGVSVFSDEKSVHIVIPDTLLFVPSTFQLIPSAEEVLRKIAGEVRANYPDALLEIGGHTDSKSTDPINVTQAHDISSAKSLAVMSYFIKSLRWDTAKIKTASFGSGKPIIEGGTTEERSKNNRVEVVVIP